MEYMVLGLFCIGLLLCILLDVSIIYALLTGLIMFMLYGRHKGFLSYSGIFNRTGLLDNVKQSVSSLGSKTNRFTALLCTAVGSGMIACNQTLTILNL